MFGYMWTYLISSVNDIYDYLLQQRKSSVWWGIENYKSKW